MGELRRVYHRIGVALLVVSSVLIGQDARATGPTALFNLPSGELAKMIFAFGQQANVKVWYTSPNGSVEGITTRPVSGTMSASEALSRMLEGTNFTWEWETESSVVLHPRPPLDSMPNSLSEPSADERIEGSAQPMEAKHADALQEVLVTGTFLRGVDAPMIHVDRQALTRTGFGTAEAALDVLPMNFLGGARNDFGNTLVGNFNHGQTPNLRGLGSGATLVLVDGHRQPASGTEGNFVDISSVPVSAIERIDVMPDGASALYGSDAIAGVVNVILRHDLDRAETRTRLAAVQGGGGNELLLAQLATRHWDSGSVLFDYEFSRRDALPISERAYAANADKRQWGGDDFRSYRSNPGNILDPTTFQPAYGIPPNQGGAGLAVSDLRAGETNLHSRIATGDLLPERKTNNLYVTGEQSISTHLEAFADLRYSRRDEWQTLYATEQVLTVPASNAYYINPFGPAPSVLVAYSFQDDLGPSRSVGYTETSFGTLGLRSELPREWRVTLSGSYGREHLHWDAFNLVDPGVLASALADPDPKTAFNPFGSGSHTNPTTLESIRTTQRERATSAIVSADLIADGSLLDLPAGAVKLAVGVGNRREQLLQKRSVGSFSEKNAYGRRDASGFTEFSAPLTRYLGASAAARFDRYNDFGATVNKKLGLRWTPSAILKARASWGTSFRAPLLVDLNESNVSAGILPLPDPRSATGQSVVLVQEGGNAHLRQETAKSWSGGLDLAAWSGFGASLTYFSIDYRNRIVQPGSAVSPFFILFDEDRWSEIITRDPSRAQVDAVCATPTFYGSRENCFKTAPAAIIDARLRNLSSTHVEGLDTAVTQTFTTSRGALKWSLDGTYLLKFNQLVTRSSSAVNLLDTVDNPIALRLRTMLDWYQHGEHLPGFAANFTAHYAGGYQDNRSVPHRHIDALATFDMQMSYRAANGMEVACNAVNVLGADPPFVNGELGYDVSNAEPTGRALTLLIQKTW